MEARERMRFDVVVGLLLVSVSFWSNGVKSECSATERCVALASYYIWNGTNLSFISSYFSTTIDDILSYNPQITDPNYIYVGRRLNVPFSCHCINNQFMGHLFTYQYRAGRDYQVISQLYYSNLTTVEMMTMFNSYPGDRIPDTASLIVAVNCSCGNSHVSKNYGLFVTYPLRPRQSLSRIANEIGLPESLLQDYNPGVDFSSGTGLVFIPGRDQNGSFPPLRSSSIDQHETTYSPPKPSSSRGISKGVIAGISTAAVIGAISLAVCIYFAITRMNSVIEENAHGNTVAPDHDFNAQGGF